jgi:hypothetical protein
MSCWRASSAAKAGVERASRAMARCHKEKVMSIRIIALVALLVPVATAQRMMERLGRGVIAMRPTGWDGP